MDKDGCISIKEFKKWWLSGFFGVSSHMKQFIAQRLYDLMLFDDLHPSVTDYLKRFIGENEGLTKNNIQINVNKVHKAGTELYIKALLFS